MKILVIGDIFGKPGRKAATTAIKKLKRKYKLDLIIANGENVAHGKGLTPRTYRELLEAGIDYLTTGNHIYAKESIFEAMEAEDTRILRPINFPKGSVGIGEKIIEVGKRKILLANLIGRVFMAEGYDDPFRSMDALLEKYKNEKLDAILVDFHAEATSEKIAMKHYLDGRVTALWGTHTHVPTADAHVTEAGTAYISDLGFVGPIDSVIGIKKENIIESFLSQTKFKTDIPEGPCHFNAAVLEISGQKAKKITPVQLTIK